MTVRVRIGPSPTGEPHVGTAYIALFNLALAKKHGGKFVLRIEDTDRERSRPEWEQQIMAGLRWLDLGWDEGPDVGGPFGPYRQSERAEIYRAHADQLLESGHAYRCFCTKERLDQSRAERRAQNLKGYDRHCRDLPNEEIQKSLAAKTPFVLRMKMPVDGDTIIKDELRGDVSFPNKEVDDQILMKSDGFPTYHLANVVDDHLMEISHVIRAEEWISSTPKHLVLYEMFGWQPPKLVHMPLLRNKDKSKISKRKNPVSIMDYKDRGFLPQAVVNYLGTLGFTMPDAREMFSFDEFAEALDFSRISLGGPIFDLEKLTWYNGKYYREQLSEQDLIAQIRTHLFSEDRIQKIVPLIRERIDTLEAFVPATEYFFSGDLEIDGLQLKPKKRELKETREILELLIEELETQVDFGHEAIEARLRAFAEQHEWHPRDLFSTLRIATTGRNATPPLFETISALGRAKVRRRLRSAVEALKVATKTEAQRKQKEEKERKKREKAEKKAAAQGASAPEKASD